MFSNSVQLRKKKGVKLEAGFPETPSALIEADIGLMNRALTNLIDNAIDHTPEGGKVTVSTTRRGKDMVLEIKDTGAGIPAEDIPRIFDRFYQVDKSRTNNNGAGLGLAIAQKILRLHGAKVNVNSAENKGTTFEVAIPSLSI